MIASSVFVLSALTLTGVYMQSKNAESKDDGYTIDFAALENNTGNKSQEIAQNRQTSQGRQATPGSTTEKEKSAQKELGIEDDVDYMPLEAGSGLVEIPGLTDAIPGEAERLASESMNNAGENDTVEKADVTEKPDASDTEETAATPKTASSKKTVVSKELHFAEADGLLRPVEGEVLLPFSMDSSIYFSTLDQYKYNPALMLQAEEGTAVTACAEGKVIDIFEDAEIGHAVTMELGDGYELTYGQLKEINVSLGSYVNPGENVGKVAAPTKYFSLEGANLYLKLTAEGTPVTPEGLFR